MTEMGKRGVGVDCEGRAGHMAFAGQVATHLLNAILIRSVRLDQADYDVFGQSGRIRLCLNWRIRRQRTWSWKEGP